MAQVWIVTWVLVQHHKLLEMGVKYWKPGVSRTLE